MSVPKGNQPPNSRILSQVQAPQRGPQSIQIARAAPPIQLSDEYVQRTITYQQSAQPQLRGPLHPQTLPANSNNPHDMSKQPIPSQPGLPNSAALQPVSQMIFSGPVSTRPQHYYTRQSTPRPISNVSQRPPMNMNMTPPSAPPQPQQTFFQAPIGTNMLTVPPHMTTLQQPIYMQGGVQQYRTSPYPQQSFPIQAQTQALYIQGGNQYGFPTTAPPSAHNTTVYYPTMISTRPPSVPTMGTGQATVKKEKKIIRIQDPNTERDITEEIMSGGSNNPTPPLSGPPSARETPPSIVTTSNASSEIAVQFATQVAAAAGLPSKDQQPHSNIRTGVTSEKFNEVKEPKLCSSKAEVTSNKDVSIHIGVIQNENSSSKLNEVKSNNILTPTFPTPSTPIIVSLAKDEIQVEEISETVQTIKPATVVLPEENKVEEVQPVLPQKFESETLPTLIKKEPVEKSISESVVEIKPPVIEIKENVEHDDNLPHENGEVPIGDIAEQTSEKWEHESKDMRKQKGKKKQSYLNRKGESKEGGDMDAFVDKEEVTTPNVLPNTVESTLIEDLSSKEEERKVAEKNEENMKVSREFQQNVEKDEDPVIEETAAKIQPPTLKYNYKEDQWSPLNPEGKRQYDRAFLLHLQSKPMSLKKPEGLPDLEVIKETANRVKPFENRQPGMGITRNISTVPDFTPGFVKSSTNSGRGGASVRGPRQQSKAEAKPKKSFTLSISHDVKLNKSENAWKPTHKGPKDVDPEIAKTEDLLKKVRGILNKLTPQKFQTLVTQVNELNIDTEERLKGVIDLVFEKAVDEPNFSVAYANMCKCLAMMKVPINPKEKAAAAAKDRTPLTGKEADYVNFRKLLLNKCQKEFEKDVSDDLDRERRTKEIEKADSDDRKKVLTDELNEAERRAKRRSLGNIRFIGELFKLNMLTSTIMHECLKKLLSQGDEDSLECLCRLLTTIGKDMENEKVKAPNKPDNSLDGYFKQMQETVNKKQTSSRVRFMLQDVVELKMNNWIPRRDDNNPKTIDQIHQEAEKEALEREMLLQQPVHTRRSDDRDKRKRGGGGNAGTTGDDGWNTVSSKSSGRNELNRLKLSKPNLDEIQLGPGRGFGLWGRGSSGGGTKITSQESDTKASGPSNRFSALAGEQTTSTIDSRRGVARTSAPSSRDSSKGRGSQLPPSTRNSKPVPASQKEREQAIAAVKNIAGGESGRAQADEGVENNSNREENRREEDDSVMLKGPTDLSQAEIEKSLEGLVDEFLSSPDFNDALLSICEICAPSTIHIFVSTVINSVLERSSQARREASRFMDFLVKQKVLTLEQYIKGLQQILNMAEEYVIDVPRIWEYLGEVIAPMIEENSLPLNFLKIAAQPCIETQLAGTLVAEVLHVLVKNLGSHKVGEMWRSSGLQWTDFLSPQQNLQDFIREKKMEFTVSQSESHVNTSMPMDRIKADLDSLLKKHKNDNEAIYDWIAVYVGPAQIQEAAFVRALVTAVCESAIIAATEKGNYRVDDAVIRLRSTLLHKYLDHKEEMELQALYALQALMHRMEHPQGILRQLFEIFYDTDIISEDGFIQWNSNNDPAEQEGRGVAASSVQSFFTWLQEAEESIDDES